MDSRTVFFILAILVYGVSQAAEEISEKNLEHGYKICFIGDTGTGGSNQLKVAKALEREACDQVRVLGDVVYSSGLRYKNDRKFKTHFYRPYRKIIEQQNIPFHLVMGNHDHLGKPKIWYGIANSYPNIIFPNLYYFERFGDICFVSLDTNIKHREQLAWLDSIYKNEGALCKLSFAVAHHPLLSVGAHGDASRSKRKFLTKAVIGKVDAYFSGHDHNLSYEGSRSGTHLFVSGSGAATRELSERAKPGHYAIAAKGFVTVKIDRSSGVVKANYEFRVVRSEDDVRTAFSGSFDGVGIRQMQAD